MSENKTFEDLFLSESKEENLKIRELDILLVSDIHKSYGYLEKLKEWQVANKRLFNYIFCTGDFLNMTSQMNESNVDIAKAESELSSIITFLENMCLVVIYIGGNHDPKTLFKTKDSPTLTIRSTNLHKRSVKIANDLYVFGVGGSIPCISSVFDVKDHNFIPYLDVGNKIIWEGYPYNEDNYKNADDQYLADLNESYEKLKYEIEEHNTTKNLNFILLSHIGPFYSNTSITEHENKCVYMGSQNLQEFLKKSDDVILNIHGHTHSGKGNIKFGNKTIINPGSLAEGSFSVIKLKRNFNDEWNVVMIEYYNL